METSVSAPARWRRPEELVAVGYERSGVVMMNEAHNMLLRSVRTRRVGRRVLPAAHAAGVRHLAMEALDPLTAERANETRALPPARGGYLGQPEMRELVDAALGLGWTLVAYEARPGSPAREEEQARKLVAAVSAGASPLLVWCGNSHLAKAQVSDDWRPMALCFRDLTGVDPFSIDQTQSIEFGAFVPAASVWVEAYGWVLAQLGGAAGFLAEEAPIRWHFPAQADAFVISTDNALS